jgi:DNA polymerase-3 subunit alpha
MIHFCHLHVHNEYSILDGIGTASQYFQEAERLKHKYLALTNHGNIDGLKAFQKASQDFGVKPILGCELYIVKDAVVKEKGEERNHITVLIKNERGYRNLCKLLTYANTSGFYYRPRVDISIFLKHLEGLVVMSGCIGSLITSEHYKDFVEIMTRHEDVYLEVMPHNMKKQRELNREILNIRKAGYSNKLVATNDCHYVQRDQSEAQEVLLAIKTKKIWSDEDRFRFKIKNLYLRSAKQMQKAFERQDVLNDNEIREALETTLEIAERCESFKIRERAIKLPEILEEDKDELIELRELCIKGYRDIFGGDLKGNARYYKRFRREFSVIRKKNFERYFLIVYDFLKWCREEEIMYGPGRGSVGSSLIAYLLKITAVDPIKYRLLFNRFISLDRIDYPDIDIDIEDTRREECREYLESKFGTDKVVGVSTSVRMKGKQVMWDVCRVFGVPSEETKHIAGLIKYDFVNKEETAIGEVLKDRYAMQFRKKYPHVIDNALVLEGQIRAMGQHPAAVLLSPKRLSTGIYGNIVRRKKNLVLNWDMDEVESIGLLKLDFLGLNTLTILNEVKRLIKENHNYDLDFEIINLEDQNLFNLINEGRTAGLFQLHTQFMTSLCKDIHIEKFMHIGDTIALGRPGPLDSGMCEDYIKRKHGKRWRKKHSIYEKITQNTYGVIVYQEQVMAVINKIAGLNYATADKIRKVIGKKRDPKEFAPFKKAFIQGCKEQETFSEREALEFWSGLQKHARYSFNKAHSVEYAMLAMWTAFCKYYYPEEFIAASLSYMSSTDKKRIEKEEILEEANALGLRVIPPKVEVSQAKRWVVRDKKLYVPFIEIKSVGPKTADSIVDVYKSNVRQKGFFDIDQSEAKKAKLNKSIIEKLENVLAFEKSEDIKKDVSEYFDFNIYGDFAQRYPKLVELYDGDITSADKQDALSARIYTSRIIRKIRYYNAPVLNCDYCSLRMECRQPVSNTKGIYNVAIIAEAPGRVEDEDGIPLIHKAGQMLWKELAKYDLSRKLFHVTNVNKCYPSLTRTPTKDHIISCSNWLKIELDKIKCRLALTIGNNSLFFFTGNDSGITKLSESGEVHWNELFGLWNVYCIHPSAVLRRGSNKEAFEKGIETFAKTFNRLRGRK